MSDQTVQPSHHALQRKRATGTIKPAELILLRIFDLQSQRRHRARIRGKKEDGTEQTEVGGDLRQDQT